MIKLLGKVITMHWSIKCKMIRIAKEQIACKNLPLMHYNLPNCQRPTLPRGQRIESIIVDGEGAKPTIAASAYGNWARDIYWKPYKNIVGRKFV